VCSSNALPALGSYSQDLAPGFPVWQIDEARALCLILLQILAGRGHPEVAKGLMVHTSSKHDQR
jgi:hypothetical protein